MKCEKCEYCKQDNRYIYLGICKVYNLIVDLNEMCDDVRRENNIG